MFEPVESSEVGLENQMSADTQLIKRQDTVRLAASISAVKWQAPAQRVTVWLGLPNVDQCF